MTELDHSPLDVVAWHGNYAPYKYDLRRYSPIGPVLYDHADPSIFTVLTSPSETPGTANVDFVVFCDRWLVAENTFRPPWYHMNVMSEFMGLVYGQYDAKPQGFVPGGCSLHNMMLPHGPDREAFEGASSAELKPRKLEGTMAFMLETRFPQRVTAYAAGLDELQKDYGGYGQSLRKRFDRPGPIPAGEWRTVKLASLKAGRDGRLAVVSGDLTRAAAADAIAPTLQAALDHWAAVEPGLRRLAEAAGIGAGRRCLPVRRGRLRRRRCRAPIQWVDGSAYVTHVDLVRLAREAEMPARFWTDPLMYQGGSDSFPRPARPDPRTPDEAWGLDLEAEVAVITDDVPRAAARGAGGRHIKLVLLVNDSPPRDFDPGELAKGLGFLHESPPGLLAGRRDARTSSASRGRDNRLHLPLL